MSYIKVPLSFQRTEQSVTIERPVNDHVALMDTLVELAVFTPVGSFNADPDFGLEYWNYEYVNISDTQFNDGSYRADFSKSSIKEQCEASIAESIKAYAPENLKVTDVMVKINLKDDDTHLHGKVYSHHVVVIHVEAKLLNGMGTFSQYTRELAFMVEPTVKKIKI